MTPRLRSVVAAVGAIMHRANGGRTARQLAAATGYTVGWVTMALLTLEGAGDIYWHGVGRWMPRVGWGERGKTTG